jgi:hypothetical protein
MELVREPAVLANLGDGGNGNPLAVQLTPKGVAYLPIASLRFWSGGFFRELFVSPLLFAPLGGRARPPRQRLTIAQPEGLRLRIGVRLAAPVRT